MCQQPMAVVAGPRGTVEMWKGYFQDKGDNEPSEYVLPVSREARGGTAFRVR